MVITSSVVSPVLPVVAPLPDDTTDPSFEESSSQGVIPSNLHQLNQSLDNLRKWTKDHPLDNVIGNLSQFVLTRSQLQTNAIWCYFDAHGHPIPFHAGGKRYEPLHVHAKYGKSSASALEDPTLRARNPIKEILLKLNLPDHRFKRWCDVQSAFVSNRQILDGPFILNELLSWCKHKKFKAMVFKVDFEKIFDSIRWDYLQDILKMFGFGDKWCGLFSGIPIDSSLTLSHLFFADDDIFVGKWDSLNIRTIVNVLKCFHLASGLKINFHKSKLMGIGTRSEEVKAAAITMGCSIFTTHFVHLGVKVGGAMSRIKSWDDVVAKVSSFLSKWKLKTLSIDG
ncbi:hypothetical protein Tco_1522422 [Tanacetum coccineum]